jgi:preprotein translocase subunit SecF
MDVVALVTILGVLVASTISVLTYIKAARTKKTVEEVHVLVNDRLDKALERIGQLSGTLDAAGLDIPDRLNQTPHIGAVVQADQARP